MTNAPFRPCSIPDLLQTAGRSLVYAFVLCLCSEMPAHAQGLPFMNTGAGDAAFSQIDFAMLYMDGTSKDQQKNAAIEAQRRELVNAGVVSALDLDAPGKCIDEFNRATTLMKAQRAKEAIVLLQKAVASYPKFVSAHNALGIAYIDQEDKQRARDEFEEAAKLDDKFPGSFLNLGTLALAANDFAAADTNLEKAATLKPKDAKVLAALAFAENGNKQYEETLKTVERVHALDHRGLANVHYIAANAALNLNDYAGVQRELTTFVSEDPTNPLAPIARKNLDTLAKRAAQTAQAASSSQAAAGQAQRVQTFPNSEHLQAELKAVGNEPTSAAEPATPESTTTVASAAAAPAPLVPPSLAGGLFTIRKAVDETALFFAVSAHGHMINDLDLTNIQIRDDSKPPVRVMQFSPQSKLPLRLGLLVDTSGSVEGRFSFEKRAAEKFLEKVLNPQLDLGFVAGFNSDNDVTQDFTADPEKLGQGIEKLTNGGGTALFDAVSFACWKLAAYPESERVARVLVVLTDGEDNSSHRSLKQAIAEAEKAGVTVYTVSTSENIRPESDADQILQVLAERSGGESLFPGEIHTLDRSLDKLRDLIRSRYLVVYKPADFEANGKYRTIHIAAQRDGERLQVHVRKGYNARLEAPAN
jgi:Ca-activated chloride channel homolog